MIWPRRRKLNQESAEALVDSEKTLDEVKAQATEIRSVSKELKRIREKNHFVEQLNIIMGGHQ